MEIQIREVQGVSIAAISGDVDGKTAPRAQAELAPVLERSTRLVLDMSEVTFMSSAGLRMLLLLYRQATAQDGRVVLVGLDEQVRDTMSMTGFLKYFEVCDTVEQGIEVLAQGVDHHD